MKDGQTEREKVYVAEDRNFADRMEKHAFGWSVFIGGLWISNLEETSWQSNLTSCSGVHKSSSSVFGNLFMPCYIFSFCCHKYQAYYNWAIAISDRAKMRGRTKEAEELWKQVSPFTFIDACILFAFTFLCYYSRCSPEYCSLSCPFFFHEYDCSLIVALYILRNIISAFFLESSFSKTKNWES